MNERTVAAIRATVDLAYTALAVAVIGYTLRAELRRFIAAKRAEIDAQRVVVETRTRELAVRAGYLSHIAPRLAAKEAEPVAERMDAALDEFNNECGCVTNA